MYLYVYSLICNCMYIYIHTCVLVGMPVASFNRLTISGSFNYISFIFVAVGDANFDLCIIFAEQLLLCFNLYLLGYSVKCAAKFKTVRI